MKSFKEKIYIHREKHKNWGLEYKAKELGFDTKYIPYFGYEIEIEIEVFENGRNKVLSIMGKDVTDKDISI